ncbi:MAG: alpha/beta hydrolase [Clostridia bacterium]|nr:alpha/beta hydrolase [Clostridia bacterium]
MSINKAMRAALKALSYPEPDITQAYKLKRQVETIANRPAKAKAEREKDTFIRSDIIRSRRGYDIPVRIFTPSSRKPSGAIVFFHGGGWVCGNIDTYMGVCTDIVEMLGRTVVSVDYRLAPENKFPAGLEDCYEAAYAVCTHKFLPEFSSDEIVLMGDSAGGNLAAAVSLLARDRGEFMPQKQILIYPSTGNDHSSLSEFNSVRDNGTDYLLTSRQIEGYLSLYASSQDDFKSPYLAPLLADDFRFQPATLIITAEYCPLRDEGEEYGRRLRASGNRVKILRMKDALHGYISLRLRFKLVRKTYELIARFLEEP